MTVEVIPSTEDFQLIGGSLALDFVNTVGNRLGSSREYLTSVSEVTRWARLAGLLTPRQTLYVKPSHLWPLVAVREELYAIFRTVATGSIVAAGDLESLNQRLAEVAPLRRISGRKNFIWTWKTDASDPAYLLGPILLDAAELMVSGRFVKIRQCADETCGWLFLDRSQAGKRRWCSMSDCGNRYKARRYYRRGRVNSSV